MNPSVSVQNNNQRDAVEFEHMKYQLLGERDKIHSLVYCV